MTSFIPVSLRNVIITGIILTAILVTMSWIWSGQEVAETVFWTSLTGIIVAIIPKIEIKLSSLNVVDKTSNSGIWYFLAITMAVIGILVLIWTLIGAGIAGTYWYAKDHPLVERITESLMPSSNVIEIPPVVIAVIVIVNCAAYFLGGFLCSKTASSALYRHTTF